MVGDEPHLMAGTRDIGGAQGIMANMHTGLKIVSEDQK
jgi:hypothetical protein